MLQPSSLQGFISATIIAWRSLFLNILIYIDHDSKCNQANIFCIGGFLMLIVVGAYDVIIYDVIYLTSSCNSSFDIEFKLIFGWTRFIYNKFNRNINKYILYQKMNSVWTDFHGTSSVFNSFVINFSVKIPIFENFLRSKLRILRKISGLKNPFASF